MSNIFEIIQRKKESDDSNPAFSLGIRIKIGKFETISAITEYLSYEGLESEIDSIINELGDVKKKLESFNNRNINQGISGIDDDTSPREIWEVFSTFADNSLLIEQFNILSESRRRELADYIFSNCNMFTGKGAYFSARYVQETALLMP